jgi:hypothetical protein
MSAYPRSKDERKRRAARALAALALAHPEATEAIDEYLIDLRRECAHWRSRVRQLEETR